MRITINHCILLFIVFGLYSCSDSGKSSAEKKATNSDSNVVKKVPPPAIVISSMDAVAPDSVRKNFQNLISVADCQSPLGKYITQVNTTSDGYMYFKQTFSYKAERFEAVLSKDSAWYSLNDTVSRLPSSLIFTIRSHAFHNLLIELEQRFHDFENAEKVTLFDKVLYRVKAKDVLGKTASLYFDINTRRLSAWKFYSPSRFGDSLLVRFSDWRNVGSFNLPFRADIEQRGEKFVFNYNTIQINSPEFQKTALVPRKSSATGKTK